MKKVIAFLLCFVLCWSLVGCTILQKQDTPPATTTHTTDGAQMTQTDGVTTTTTVTTSTKTVDAVASSKPTSGKQQVSQKPSSSTKPVQNTSCAHRWSGWTVTVAATCTAAGTRTRVCLDCDREETQTVPKAGHRESDWIVKTPATADKAGQKYTICLQCEKELQTGAIPKINENHVHSASRSVLEKESTCTEEGTIVWYCSCGMEMSTETCPPAHTVQIVERIEPRCEDTGWTESEVCAVCQLVLKEPQEIPSTGHTPKPKPGQPATCTEIGYAPGVYCSKCYGTLEYSERLPRAPHTFVNGACTVCGCLAPSEGLEYTLEGKYYYVSGIGTCKDTVLRLPDQYDGKDVRGITKQAFKNNTTIREVHVPYTVLYIREGAFANCTNLENLYLAEGVKTIEKEAFYQCTKLKALILPDSIQSVWIRAFYGCTSLKKLDMGDITLGSIGDEAFRYCSSLVSLTLPKKISRICRLAFADCGLEKIQFPNTREDFYKIQFDWGWCGPGIIRIYCTDKNVDYYSSEHVFHNPFERD